MNSILKPDLLEGNTFKAEKKQNRKQKLRICILRLLFQKWNAKCDFVKKASAVRSLQRGS